MIENLICIKEKTCFNGHVVKVTYWLVCHFKLCIGRLNTPVSLCVKRA